MSEPVTEQPLARLLPLIQRSPLQARHREPVTTGIPLPRGAVSQSSALAVRARGGAPVPLQARTLDRWPDGTVRWVLLDFEASRQADDRLEYEVFHGEGATVDAPLHVKSEAAQARITSGRAQVTIARGGAFPLSAVAIDGRELLRPDTTGFSITTDRTPVVWKVSDFTVLDAGPLRAEVVVRATAGNVESQAPLEVTARIEVFASTPAVRIRLTIGNRRRAVHAGGQWPLGDPGSIFVESAAVRLSASSAITAVGATTDPSCPPGAVPTPWTLLQASSGGEHWQSRTHVNRDGEVLLPFRGYRLSVDGTEQQGDRATPIVAVETATGSLMVTVLRFWEQFPSSLSVDETAVTIGLLPANSGDRHELQGGERQTRTFVLAFGPDEVSAIPLAWCHAPQRFCTAPDEAMRAGAVPGLRTPVSQYDPGYLALADIALDVGHGVVAKREAADEYGWRNFGDIPADHESAFQPADAPFVSHYNNQYDAVAGFAWHLLRTGDARWWVLMDDLARHVCDIDIYRTDEDKPAYNHGLFWHTNHYVDAGTSTHRTYPKGERAGGGPSAEHNYNLGLMLHYFLTGDRESRDTAISLGQWVIDMDYGAGTPFRWLSRRDTGLANRTFNHYGPGRGAGHSILACLVAHRLTAERRFLAKAEQLIARCVHPDEAISSVYVENIEGYWSYTAFLQALGHYLEHKEDLDERDAAYVLAHRSLLKFAAWMEVHERPYLERRHLLEYPTETWVAQDLRKADVFFWAARFADAETRGRYVDAGRRYLDYVTTTLPTMPGHWFARPIVLVLTQGLRAAWLSTAAALLPDAPNVPTVSLPPRRAFTPQRSIAVRRAAALATVGGLAVVALALWWWLRVL